MHQQQQEQEEQEEEEEEEAEEEGSSSSSSDASDSEEEEEEEEREKKIDADPQDSNTKPVVASDSGSEQTSDSEDDSPRPTRPSKKKLLSSDESDEDEEEEEEERGSGAAAAEPAAVEDGEKSFASLLTRKDVFGSDSDTSDDDAPPSGAQGDEGSKKTEMAIFGDVDDLSSEEEAKRDSDVGVREEEDDEMGVARRGSDEEGEGMGEGEEGEQAPQEPIETQIAVDLPHIKVDLGKGIHFVKMPNFLSVETRPFDPTFYEDELIEDEVLDEEGRTRLKLKVENTMRWRIAHDEDGNELHDSSGNPIHESNTRIVRWSDGSMSLHLGTEIFDVHVMDTLSDYNHLFIRQGSGLQGQAIFRSKLTFRPHSTDSFTHRKITMSLADKSTKQQKVKVLPIVGKDPEANRTQLIKKEEEKLRASLRRENESRRRRERDTRRALSENFLEQETNEDDENTISVSAIKESVKKKRSVAAIYSSDESDDSADSGDSLSDTPVRKKTRTKVLSDD
ncbi:MAG: RNA polymerase-associated LEO1 family protein, partial [Pseudomonadota bacterium]